MADDSDSGLDVVPEVSGSSSESDSESEAEIPIPRSRRQRPIRVIQGRQELVAAEATTQEGDTEDKEIQPTNLLQHRFRVRRGSLEMQKAGDVEVERAVGQERGLGNVRDEDQLGLTKTPENQVGLVPVVAENSLAPPEGYLEVQRAVEAGERQTQEVLQRRRNPRRAKQLDDTNT